MALILPCSVNAAPMNTGHDCQVRMSATAMIILAPIGVKWTATDELNFLAYLQGKIEAAPNARFFPMFGNAAPVRTINDNNETDVTVTYDDGSQAFIRNGTMTRTFMTNKGGLETAKAFLSFNAFSNSYGFIEIDQFNRVLRKVNTDGTFSPIPCNMVSAPTPTLAGLKTEFMSAFTLNFTAANYITDGGIATSDEDLLDLVGLINTEVFKSATASTTKLKVGVRTINAQSDLVALFPTELPLAANFIVTNKATSAVITPSAVAIASGAVEITGTYVSGTTYTVTLAAASVLYGNDIAGYEGTVSVDITIP